MKNRPKILALYQEESSFQKDFFHILAKTYSDLFAIDLAPLSNDNQLQDYQAIFAFSDIEKALPLFLFTEMVTSKGFYITEEKVKDGQAILALSSALNQFYQSLNSSLLDAFPFQIRQSDHTGQIIYHNHQFNGSFFPEDDQELEGWIYRQFQTNPQAATKHFLLPTASSDHIYFQSYYGLQDPDGHYIGTLDLVQDLKPILAQYLEETAQAIVGWSDVTSGPSISDDL